MKLTSLHYFIIFILILIGGLVFLKVTQSKSESVTTGTYDEFAQCLNDSGALFYGAFWCPHCADQKKLFGDSVSLLPYVECSTPDKKSQTQVCIDAEITGYPTWVMPDKERLPGVQPLETLAEKTGCTLPSTN